MRESIGGAWIFGIVITFISLFSGFLAYSISYTRAFNAKNQIINFIEQAEGFSYYEGNVQAAKDLSSDTSVEGKAYYLLTSMGYNYEVAEELKDTTCSTLKDNLSHRGEMMPGGYCLTKICQTGDDKMNTQYKVTTFIALKIPVVNIIVKIPISGETRTIYHDIGKYKCSKEVNP